MTVSTDSEDLSRRRALTTLLDGLQQHVPPVCCHNLPRTACHLLQLNLLPDNKLLSIYQHACHRPRHVDRIGSIKKRHGATEGLKIFPEGRNATTGRWATPVNCLNDWIGTLLIERRNNGYSSLLVKTRR